MNRIIYDELCHGKVLESSRVIYRSEMAKLTALGAQGIILGCTEISMLVDETDAKIPLFDTTRIHIDKTLEEIFKDDSRS